MHNSINIANFFSNDNKQEYEFSNAPELIKYKQTSKAVTKILGADKFQKWNRTQRGIMHFTKLKSIFSKEYVEKGFNIYDSFFSKKGFMKGNVLDVGGGWGLYRQWWEPGSNNVYIVHDPGLEMFFRGPHQIHYHYYKRGFEKPMTFVEGFAEELPYKNDVFDTCLIAASLDHFVEPETSLKEVHRCLKKGTGQMIIIQTCHIPGQTMKKSIVRRISNNLREPIRCLAKIYHTLFFKCEHLHKFSPDELKSLIQKAGFKRVKANKLPDSERLYAFEALN